MSQTPKTEERSAEGPNWWAVVAAGVFRGASDYFSTSCCFKTLSEISAKVREGDMLEFDRGVFSHWALSMGKGKVMNVCAEDKSYTEARILEMSLEEVCGSSKVRIRNPDREAKKYFDASPRPTEEILRVAKSFQGLVVPYQFSFQNCEYYSSLWRYGRGFSTQITKPTQTPVGTILRGIMASDQVRTVVDFGRTEEMIEQQMVERYSLAFN